MINDIRWLLMESGITNYKISQATGIAQTTLGRYTTGEADISNMSVSNATKLNDYYKQVTKVPTREVVNKIIGESYAVADYLAGKYYDKGRLKPSLFYSDKPPAKALHTLELMIKDLQWYVPHFKDDHDLLLLTDIVKGWDELKNSLKKPYEILVLDGLYLQHMASKGKELTKLYYIKDNLSRN